jgi:hypothetical protein
VLGSVEHHTNAGIFSSVQKYVNESIPGSSTEMGLRKSQIRGTILLTGIDPGDIKVI